MKKKTSKGRTNNGGAFASLLKKAAEDLSFAQELLRDPEAAIRDTKLSVDTASEEYQSLRLKLYHINVLLQKSLQDLLNRFNNPVGGGGGGIPGGSYVDFSHGQVINPADITALKEEILREIRKELQTRPPR